ncbi:MCM2/3/5 family-domain-containing protein [Polychytrium aggregatum]|uniref:MCM2/3/5 family-domain-containing protein n=1 Tax=Polychytrium aggregatum TaxID=110093 RepID=UPI0022FDC165|nr:MCM2/3/5 family-domain-containing protein [Polychytrium aggregatum]KAI9209755.1 MCM2/3/5 family-domain-containing protein [Polychytrium aggregatum]
MSGWDKQESFTISGVGVNNQEASLTEINFPQVEKKFGEFLRNFRVDNNYIYRDQLRQNVLTKLFFIEVDIAHLISFDEDLATQIKEKPADILPLFELAVKNMATSFQIVSEVPDCQVMLISNANTVNIRQLDSTYVSKLVRIPGITISASVLSAKATHVHIMCKDCRDFKQLTVGGGITGINLPRICLATSNTLGETKKCSMDPYVIIHDKSKFVDQQTLKLQETPDKVPVGELPRHILLSADRYLTDKVTPGTRVTITGIFDIFQQAGKNAMGASAIRSPYIRVVGMQVDVEGNRRTGGRVFTEEEESEFIAMARRPNFYEEFANSIAPSIYGNSDIKKAIMCLLFGGSKKVLPDGLRLRGDINVLLLGDPGTAKSQLLKFVEKVAPIGVYTSGKGSSAAGLTASVIRDPSTREFLLEGGAMVLADGGVVCIDEFDKMRDEDRVAIHEAMEQQTISIAKAGITTILNSRTSVLAAANPIFGRYDDMKTPGENIDFQSTILSRFDLIFIVRDEHNEQLDMTIAKHVLGIHMNRSAHSNANSDIDMQKMRSYISYCKAKCAPRLTPEAAEKLSSHFAEVRGKVRQMEKETGGKSSIPITVRQLEAIIRVSESLAKMTLSPLATERHVAEAIRLFNDSTMNAVNSGQGLEGMVGNGNKDEVNRIQTQIRRRLPIGSRITERNLRNDLENQQFDPSSINRAISILIQKETLQYRDRRMILVRIGA